MGADAAIPLPGPLRLTPAFAFAGRARELATLRALVDEVVCLQVPRRFDAVGAFYREFAQTSDGEACALLARARVREACGAAAAQAAAALPASR